MSNSAAVRRTKYWQPKPRPTSSSFEKPLTQWRLALRRFRGRRSGMVGLFLISGLILVAIFAPLHRPLRSQRGS